MLVPYWYVNMSIVVTAYGKAFLIQRWHLIIIGIQSYYKDKSFSQLSDILNANSYNCGDGLYITTGSKCSNTELP